MKNKSISNPIRKKETMTFGESVVKFYKSLKITSALPAGVEVMNPIASKETFAVLKEFYLKYFSDNNQRVFLFGINPGRFGGGITGIPFTDPVTLEKDCGIINPFNKRGETSAEFIYKMIDKWGGAEKFYSSFYITALSPLGFIKDGKNYNYYDDNKLLTAVESFIVSTVKAQLKFPCRKDVAICIGTGKNFDYFSGINAVHNFFDKIIAVPHPRYIMQYERKKIKSHIGNYVKVLNEALNS